MTWHLVCREDGDNVSVLGDVQVRVDSNGVAAPHCVSLSVVGWDGTPLSTPIEQTCSSTSENALVNTDITARIFTSFVLPTATRSDISIHQLKWKEKNGHGANDSDGDVDLDTDVDVDDDDDDTIRLKPGQHPMQGRTRIILEPVATDDVDDDNDDDNDDSSEGDRDANSHVDRNDYSDAEHDDYEVDVSGGE